MSESTEHLTPEVVQQRLVLPRRNGRTHKVLGSYLDGLEAATDAAIHVGYVKRNKRKLDAALVKAIAYAEEARKLLRKNQ